MGFIGRATTTGTQQRGALLGLVGLEALLQRVRGQVQRDAAQDLPMVGLGGPGVQILDTEEAHASGV